MKLTKDLVAASAIPLILSLLEEGESYGYAIIQRIGELSKGEITWTDGMLYPVLHRLETQGLIRANWRISDAGRKRKYYALTRAGAGPWRTRKNNGCSYTKLCPTCGERNMLEWQQHIVSWRRALADIIGPDANTLDELESHVRDEMDRLVRQGQAPEHAVLEAITRIGTADKLATEFAKVAKPWWPIRFVLAGTFLAIAGSLALIGTTMAARVAGDGLLFIHVATVTLGYLLTYSIGALAGCFALRRPFQDLSIGQKTSWIRVLAWLTVVAFAMTLTGTVLGAIWANLRWGRFWSWDVKEVGALLTVSWQAILLALLRSRPAKIRWLLCWGMLGNVVVTFAWFVSNVMISDGQLAAYGYSRDLILAFFYVILVTHTLLAATALAPSGWLRVRKSAG